MAGRPNHRALYPDHGPFRAGLIARRTRSPQPQSRWNFSRPSSSVSSRASRNSSRSSGHLVLVPAFFGWEDQGLAFDAGLHAGTLAAVLLYFRRDWFRMGFTAAGDLRSNGLAYSAYATDTRILGYIVVGTVPAAVVGLLFDDWIEANLREPWIVAIALAVAGTAMLLADLRSRLARTTNDLRLTDAIIIGCAQALALFLAFPVPARPSPRGWS
ncbi:MAG: undecaprenyl-diphosphate phosphatase [Dehalococcoidia bacterium]|nr:undecaprenyl-diphosphate phosphatase [Dehalococcoidia bacterium]